MASAACCLFAVISTAKIRAPSQADLDRYADAGARAFLAAYRAR
jgi:hypothetical protein